MTAITQRGRTSNLQRLTAALLALSAVLFVVGIVLERAGPAGDVHTEAPPSATQTTSTHVENGNEAGETQIQPTGSAPSPEPQGETTLGFNLENPWLVGAFALASLALAAALLRFSWPALLLAFLFGAGAAMLDLQEVLTQLGRGNSLVAGVAGLVAVAHVAVAVLAILAWAGLRAASPPSPPASTAPGGDDRPASP
jgi:hypothetical protein